MTLWLKQSTAFTWKAGPFLDDTDGKTAETGLTISQADIRLSKNGGDYAQTNNAAGATHDEAGYYDVPLNTTDTGTLGTLRCAISESGALPVWETFLVVPANVWDSLFGADKLQVHADEITAGLITATAIADGAIDAATFAAGAINAAAIATGAIDADSLAADAGAEIADAIWDEALAGHVAAGSAGAALAAATAPTAAAVADAVWDEATSGHSAAGSAGKALTDILAFGTPATAAAISDAVWDELISGHAVSGSTAEALSNIAAYCTGSTPVAGASILTYTLTSSVDGSPIPEARVWVTSDSAGTVLLASGTTNSTGQVTFYLSAGTVYLWRQKAGWNFSNPDTETVT